MREALREREQLDCTGFTQCRKLDIYRFAKMIEVHLHVVAREQIVRERAPTFELFDRHFVTQQGEICERFACILFR